VIRRTLYSETLKNKNACAEQAGWAKLKTELRLQAVGEERKSKVKTQKSKVKTEEIR
jgi:hypothetical protein